MGGGGSTTHVCSVLPRVPAGLKCNLTEGLTCLPPRIRVAQTPSHMCEHVP